MRVKKKSAMMLKDGVAVTWLRDNNGGRHLPTSVIYLFKRIKRTRGILLSLVNVITIWNCIVCLFTNNHFQISIDES